MQVGNQIKVLNEAAEGKVVKIEGKTIYVEIDGFDFPYKAQDLIVVEDDLESIRKKYLHHSPKHKSVKSADFKPQKELTEKEKIEELGRVRGKRNTKGILEFDLHIHDLLAKSSHMTPGEMLNYQLEYAVHCLEETIKKREPSLVFIHGVGKGVLKAELHKIIRAYRFSYHDGFMQEYGVGATRVELRDGY